jgi:hypothetical protein
LGRLVLWRWHSLVQHCSWGFVVIQEAKRFPPFMHSDNSLLRPQSPPLYLSLASCMQSTLPHSVMYKIHFNIILTATPQPPRWKIFYEFTIWPTRTTCRTHRILPHSIRRTNCQAAETQVSTPPQGRILDHPHPPSSSLYFLKIQPMLSFHLLLVFKVTALQNIYSPKLCTHFLAPPHPTLPMNC